MGERTRPPSGDLTDYVEGRTNVNGNCFFSAQWHGAETGSVVKAEIISDGRSVTLDVPTGVCPSDCNTAHDKIDKYGWALDNPVTRLQWVVVTPAATGNGRVTIADSITSGAGFTFDCSTVRVVAGPNRAQPRGWVSGAPGARTITQGVNCSTTQVTLDAPVSSGEFVELWVEANVTADLDDYNNAAQVSLPGAEGQGAEAVRIQDAGGSGGGRNTTTSTTAASTTTTTPVTTTSIAPTTVTSTTTPASVLAATTVVPTTQRTASNTASSPSVSRLAVTGVSSTQLSILGMGLVGLGVFGVSLAGLSAQSLRRRDS